MMAPARPATEGQELGLHPLLSSIHPKELTRLDRSFYVRGSVTVARELLGKLLCRQIDGVVLGGRIVEAEAYRGALDPASHAYRGRTTRNEVMFRRGGYLYVYFTYGMHFCCNVVTGREGRAEAVLIRAVEPVWGIEQMARHRGLRANQVRNLSSGPGRTCQAFAIGRSENGADLCGETLWIARLPEALPRLRVTATSRVGIRQGRDRRWRFLISGSPFLSQGRPS